MSKSSLDRLVYMANQIAREFTAQQPTEAVQATYDHMWHFWDPRMRAQILDLGASGGSGLSEVARAAIERLAATNAEPRPVTKATEFNKAVGEGGDSTLMSDAG